MNGPQELQIKVERTTPASLVTPVGEIDLGRSPTLRQELGVVIAEQPRHLVVNLAEVSYMDSSGVATLVEALQQCRAANIVLTLCAMQDRVRSIFEIARLDMVFSIKPTVAAALES